MFDTDVVAQEAFLRDALSELKDNRLRDIVTTIQQEQNLVIRAPMNGPLLVQGAAGSGKTTIALHRIAYLLYAHQDTLTPKNLMILAPNPLFLDYISEVLPELGVEDVVQTTYVKLCQELMGKHGPKVAPADPLTLMLERNLTKDAAERMVRCGRYKGSLAFRKKAEDYLGHLQSAIMPEASLTLGKLRIYSRKELLRIFTEDFAPYPLVPRIREMEKHLSFKMADSAARLVAYYEKDCQTRVNALKLRLPPGEERQHRILEVYEARDLRIKEVRTQAEERLKTYIAAFKVPTLLEAYQDFLAHYSADDPDLLAQLAAENREELLAGRIRREDLAALVLLCHGLFGLSRKLSIQHVVMDEAQDFSPFELSLLGTLTGSESVTLMGDLAQSIHPFQGIESWKEVAEQCYQRAGLETMTLVTSYRSTTEIMAVAESVLAHFTSPERPAAKPVLRHGPAPRFYRVGEQQRLPALQALALEFAESYSSVAVITKTPAAAKSLYSRLRKNTAVHLITQKDTHYEGGVMVLPAALAKGLEFDAAILADVDRETYCENPLDCHLLYVSLTRPLHALAGVFSGEPSPLLSAVSFTDWA
nr:UvrD-helicase domain-containing protein [Gehongia tenuis]